MRWLMRKQNNYIKIENNEPAFDKTKQYTQLWGETLHVCTSTLIIVVLRVDQNRGLNDE